MSMAGGIFLWSGTPGGSGTFVTAAPQRDLRALAGCAVVWGAAALFAPAQPTPAAAERLTGTHQQAIAQSQNRSSLWAPIPAGAVVAQSARPVSIYAPGQYPEPRPSWIKSPQIDAGPFLSFELEALPQDPPQLKALVFGQPPASVAAVTTILRSVPTSAPQSDPTQARPLIFGQVPPTALTPPIQSLSASPQSDPSQLKAQVWSPAPTPQQDQPAIHFLQGAPQLTDLTQQAKLWWGLPVVATPIRPFTAAPQQVDLTQQALWFTFPPPSIAPTDPPNRSFVAGPIASDVAQYGQARITFWSAPPDSVAPPVVPDQSAGHPAPITQRELEDRLLRHLHDEFANPEYHKPREILMLPSKRQVSLTVANRSYATEISVVLWMLT